MPKEQRGSDNELHEIIETKLTALMVELVDGGWSTVEAALAMSDVLKTHWLNEIEALRDVRDQMPGSFVSDGNEG